MMLEVKMHSTDSEFSSLVRSGQTVLVDFSALSWCSPCRQLLPIIERVSAKLSGRCKVIMMDIDTTSSHRSLGIQSVPTLVLFKGGQVVWKNEGLISEAALMNALARFC